MEPKHLTKKTIDGVRHGWLWEDKINGQTRYAVTFSSTTDNPPNNRDFRFKSENEAREYFKANS